MSLRTALRFQLVAIFTMGFVGSALAQTDEAPMPRAKKRGEFSLGLQIGGPQVIQVQYELKLYGAPAVAPMPREASRIIIQDEEEIFQVESPGRLRIAPPPAPPSGFAPAKPAQAAPCCEANRSAPPATFGPVPLAFDFGFEFVPRPAQRLPVCNEMNYTWNYSTSVVAPPQCVPMPRAILEVVGDLDFQHCEPLGNRCARNESPWAPVFRAAPAMIPHRVVTLVPPPPAGAPVAPCSDPCGWWLDATPVPQPRHVMPVVVVQQVWERGPMMVADGRSFGLRLGSECSLPARGYATSAVAPTAGACCQSAPLACCEKAGKLAGTWYREVDGAVLEATFEGNDLKLCMTQCEDGVTICCTLTADYAITKEGLVHGVVTGVDVDVQCASNRRAGGSSAAEMSAELQSLVDSPFSFRLKQTSSGIMVSNLKVAMEGMGKKELALACGMYKLATDGKVPAAKPMKNSTSGPSRCDGPACRNVQVEVQTLPIADPLVVPTMPTPTVPGTVAPVPHCESVPGDVIRHIVVMSDSPVLPSSHVVVPNTPHLQHPPQYFPPMPMPTPTKPGCCEMLVPMTAPQPFSPLKPANIPAGDFGMMADVFGQMLDGPQSCQLQPAGMGTVTPRPLPTQPIPAPIARSLTGTWVRQVGPYLYVVKITPGEITITAKAATELENGKTAVDGMILTAEYHLARDGVTAVGLVTCVDARLEGDLDGADMNALQEELAKFQKAMTDKPFAMSLRVHGDSLVVGNVRLPEVGPSNCGPSPLTALGGCYSSVGDKPLPRLRPVKAEFAPRSCPSPGQVPPQFYIGPDLPPPPLPSQPPVMVVPAPYQVGPPLVTDRIPPPAPSAYDLHAPVPTMPTPTPPAFEKPKGKKGKKDADATERMQKLLNQSEMFGTPCELRQIQNSWRRFWFNDQPSHLTPERIHGGIL